MIEGMSPGLFAQCPATAVDEVWKEEGVRVSKRGSEGRRWH